MANAGDLNVRLTASTGEFVGGMASAQRSIDNVTNGAKRGRAALGALGGALRSPGLSRSAGFGGFAGNAASALGFGALGGGVAGIGATLLFAGVTALTNVVKDMNRRADEAAESLRQFNKEMVESAKATANTIAQINIDAADDPKRAAAEAALRGEAANRRVELESRRNEILRLAISDPVRRDLFKEQIARNPTLIRSGEINRVADNDERIRLAIVNLAGVRGSYAELRNIEGALEANAEVLARGLQALVDADTQAAAEVAQKESETADKWERSLQRMSDQLTTHVGGIATQISQLIMKSGRGE